MPIRSRLLPALLLASSLLSPARAHADGPAQADLLARLIAARSAADLTDPALKPWHMLTTFDCLDFKGVVTEQGTFEEWWAAPDKWHQRFTSHSFNQDLYRIGNQFFSSESPRTPYFLDILAQHLRSPIPSMPANPPPSIAFESKRFGSVQLDCILVQPAQSPAPLSFGHSPTYCLDPQQPNLRFFMENGVQNIVRNRVGVFQGKHVALDINIEEGEHSALRAKVDQLQGGTTTEADFTPPANLAKTTLAPRVPGSVIAGRKIGGPPPVYPVEAKLRRISGTVLLHAIIDRDGRMQSTEVIWSPDPSLSKAAIEAVSKWIYQPYLLNGQPTEVETTITVNFSIAG